MVYLGVTMLQVYKILYLFYTFFSDRHDFLSKHLFIYLLLLNFVIMKREVKLLLLAGAGYVGYRFYRTYQAVKNLTWSPTGIKFTWIKERFTLGGTLFVDIINPTPQSITIDGLSGSVLTKSGIMIGDYKLGKTELKPGATNVRISWGGRSTATLLGIVAEMIKGNWPILVFKSVVTYKGIPIPDSYTMDTKNFKPSFA